VTDRAKVERLAGSGPLQQHPALARYVQCFLDTFLVQGRLDPRLRELTILRIAWRCRQPFEWTSHHRVARRIGVSDVDILAVRVGPGDARFGPAERVMLTAADEVVDLGRISEGTYAGCRLGQGDDRLVVVVGEQPVDAREHVRGEQLGRPVDGGGERGVGRVAPGRDPHERRARRQPGGVGDLPTFGGGDLGTAWKSIGESPGE
jgi:hypothetical protein